MVSLWSFIGVSISCIIACVLIFIIEKKSENKKIDNQYELDQQTL